jgi:hypothetical protein
MITWDTGDGSIGQVYVAVNDIPEKIFADKTAKGQREAPWINKGGVYEFRLYAGRSHKTLLASVKVRKTKSPAADSQ